MKKKLILLALPVFIFATTVTFERALDKTLKNNQSLKAKKLSIENAKLDLKKAKGYNYGTLTFNENIAKSNNALNAFGMKLMAREASFSDFGFDEFLMSNAMGKIMQNNVNVTQQDMASLLATQPDKLNNPDARTNFETKLVYQIPLFTGFKLSDASKMAKLQVKATISKYKHDEKQLGIDVLKAYNGAVAAKYFIDATEKAKEATSSFVNFASEMYKEGFVTSIDVKQASVYDMKINSQLLEAKNSYSLAIAYLKFLTNDTEITDVGDFKNIQIKTQTLEISQNKAYKNRDDFQWMEQNTATMKRKVSFEKSDHYPMIGAHLEYGYNDNKLNNFNSDKDYYTMAIGLEYKIFDGFKISNNVQKAKINYAKTKHYLDYIKNGIKLQVEKAILTFKTKKSVLKQKSKAKNLADEVLIQANEMYQNQLMKMSDLLMQQALAQKARAELILAKYETTIAAAKLKLALGQNLQ